MATLELALALLMFVTNSCGAAGIKRCPNCGSTPVPYPLSTGEGCGDPNYRVYCNTKNLLEFRALNGSSYEIVSIRPASQRLLLRPAPLLDDVCASQDLGSGGMLLNQSLPFSMTSSNTILLLSCSPTLLLSPLNCTSSSICHQYIDQVPAARPCGRTGNLCCTFVAGGFSTAYRIHISNSRCRAYRSILNLDSALPATRWTDGVEIQWAPPPEPSCRSQRDCGLHSVCAPDPKSGASKCLCNANFYWDPVSGTCARNATVCRKNCHRRALAGGLGSAALLVACIVLTLIIYGRRRLLKGAHARLGKERAHILSANSGGKCARIFSGKEVKKATNGFSQDRVLGSGGFGEVYKGLLEDRTCVAVKAAKVGNAKGNDQMLNEVRILSQVNHRSLVRLLGCCVETEQPLMIYEYISNGTLFDHLHTSKGIFLDWSTRLNIAFQTAEGLAYLHSAAVPPIYHRDVKSSNILLDDKLNAKVSDFGLSRLAEPDLTHISTCAQGTLGYLDPEYYRNYQLTDKSDVYSFGVVLLELVTSEKAIDFSRGPDHVNLAVYVMEKAEEGKIMDVFDPRLTADSSEIVLDTIRALAFLALRCLQEKRQDRPTMKEVAEELQYYIVNMEAAGRGEYNPNVNENGLILSVNLY